MDDNERRYPQRIRKPAHKEYSAASSSRTYRWSHEERVALAANLRKYGDRDVNILSNSVGTKGTLRLYNYLVQHKEEANKKDDTSENNDDVRKDGLRAWIKYMRGKKQKYPTPSPVALSMLMMSLLEDHPVPTDGEVSFPEAYEYLFRLFSQRHDRNFSSLSIATKKFVQLSILSLIKEAMGDIDKYHDVFVQAANVDKSKSSTSLPPDVAHFLSHDHFNPLGLDELVVKPN